MCEARATQSMACGPASPGNLLEKQPQAPPAEWNPLFTTHPNHQEARFIGEHSCAHRAALCCCEWAPPTALGRKPYELLPGSVV